ncbi:ArsC/Spx/MgsR family protein [Mycobacterium sp.]|uniref:ArsC/Spx/MgsR family protein n=1 Tax=Mycobacterium sp. TaxID=1785 RepID=UPI0025D94743|nr:ArsC/Spx/MgsR family protein [Mycobacterium sp.]MBW0015148.1 arsenate reductase (glutaredoxin) [Mycobacterium sp.]
MADTVIFHNPKCSTSRKTLELLRDNGIEPNIVYDELNLADASDDELLDAMAEHPILIERPFVVTPKGTRLARPIDAVREIL